MEFETLRRRNYDAFDNADNMGYETVTDYIRGENIKISRNKYGSNRRL